MLILASQSKTRRSLLKGAGLRFTTVAAALDERAVENAALARGADGRQVARLLAEAKAQAVAELWPDAVIVGADQTLLAGPDLLHKPRSLAEASQRLERLRGTTHELHAGVALAVSGRIVWSAVDSAALTMRDFSPLERDEVLALEGSEVLGSVGAYRLEGPSIRLFDSIRGDYFTVLGLPLLPLLGALRQYAPQVFHNPGVS